MCLSFVIVGTDDGWKFFMFLVWLLLLPFTGLFPATFDYITFLIWLRKILQSPSKSTSLSLLFSFRLSDRFLLNLLTSFLLMSVF